MAIDLTGGIDPAREYMFAERPDNPEMRDSVSFWVFDDRGQVGLPRVGIRVQRQVAPELPPVISVPIPSAVERGDQLAKKSVDGLLVFFLEL